MDVEIVQIDIGGCSQWGDENTPNLIRQYCMPSVERYAQRFNYKYTLVKESTYAEKIGPLDFLMTKAKHYSFERYLRLKTKHDAVVYIDNDVYIKNDADMLPEIDGIMAAREPGKTDSQKLFTILNNLDRETSYYNSGVIMADKFSAQEICDYMVYRAKNHIKAKGKNTDNMMFNEYLLERKPHFLELTEHWNYMPMLNGSTKSLNSNFMHLVGVHGKEFLKKLSLVNMPMANLLENIANGKIKVDVA